MKLFSIAAIVCLIANAGCMPKGEDGAAGKDGKDGAAGPRGLAGKDGVSPTVGGTRLRAIYRTGVDGSQAPVSWYDTELGIECAFGVAEDAALRCLPVVKVAAQADMYYATPSCGGDAVATAAFHAPGACAAKPAYILWSPEACPRVNAVYAVGGEYTAAMPAYKATLPLGTCSLAGQDADDLLAVTHMDPEQFMYAIDIYPY